MEKHSSKRLVSIEFLKGIGIIYLILLHQIGWLFIEGDIGGLRYSQANSLIYAFCYRSGLHVLGFQIPLLAGLTFYFSYQQKKFSWFENIKRALLLYVLGCIMNALAWGPQFVFTWDVLQYFSVVLLFTYPLIRYLGEKKGPIAVLILGLLSLAFSNQFPFSHLKSHYVYNIIIGDWLGSHYWALCPWYVMFAVGIYIAHLFKSHSKYLYTVVPAIGLICILLSLVTGNFFPQYSTADVWGTALFKPSAFFVIGILGFSLLVIPLAEKFLTTNEKLKNVISKSIIVAMGRAILWIYLATSIIGFNLTALVNIYWSFTFEEAVFLYFILLAFHFLIAYLICFVVNSKFGKEYQ